MAYDENFLRRTYGAGVADRQAEDFNALRMNTLRSAEKRADRGQQMLEQQFTEEQQINNTKRLLGAIPIVKSNPQALPRVLEDLSGTGIINRQEIPKILQAAQADPESFERTLDDLEEGLRNALGSGISGRVSKTWVNPETGTMWGMSSSGQPFDTGVAAQQYAMRPLETGAGTAPFDPSRGQVGPTLPGTEAPAMRERAAQTEAAKTTAKGEAQKRLELPQARSRLAATEAKMDRLASSAESILNDDALWKAVGLGQGLSKIPGSAGARVRAKIENLQSQAGLAVLQDMRDNSKTGGAVGQVSNYEQQILQNNLAALGNVDVSPEDYRQAVQQIVEYANSTKGRFRDAFYYQYPDLQPEQTQQQMRPTLRYNPQTGQLEPI